MNTYKRSYPLFSLCGLNCGLCPRHHTEGSSKCPGCGGEDFALKHPSCKVINCAKKHGQIEYCFECSDYPCDKYTKPYTADSFITYAKVTADFQKAKDYGLDYYQTELNEKLSILEYLLHDFNDGRRKNYYCIAVNLLDLPELQTIQTKLNDLELHEALTTKERIDYLGLLLESYAAAANLELKLKK